LLPVGEMMQITNAIYPIWRKEKQCRGNGIESYFLSGERPLFCEQREQVVGDLSPGVP